MSQDELRTAIDEGKYDEYLIDIASWIGARRVVKDKTEMRLKAIKDHFGQLSTKDRQAMIEQLKSL